MQIDTLRRALQLRSPSLAPQLPASVAVGLALPAAVLGIVLIGMDLHFIGMLAWTTAIVMMGFALRGFYAVGVIVTLALSGVMLWRFMLGQAAILSGAEQMALILLTVLAAIIGRLIAREIKQRDHIGNAKLQLDVFATTIESIFEASKDCIKVLGTDGTILSINSCGVKLSGAESAEQMLGRSWFSLWGAEQQKLLASAWHQVLTRGYAQFEGSCRILTGERRTWHNTFTLVRTPEQSQTHVICISCDVTENINLQQTLNTGVAQLSGLLNNIHDVSFALDSNWIISFANQRAEQLCEQVGRANAVGRSLWEIFPIQQAEPAAILIRRAMEEKVAQHCEYFFAQQQIWLSIEAFPFANGINILACDITQLKQSQKVAAEETARLQVAQDIAGFGDWGFDYNHGSMNFSPRAVAMLEMQDCPQHEYKKYLLEKLDSRDRMSLVQAIINCTEAEPTMDLILRLPAQNGTQKHLHWIGRLLTDERGNAARMLGAIQDISEHLNVQHALEKAHGLVHDLVDALPQQILVIDREGRLVVANKTWLEARKQHYRNDDAPKNFFELGDAEGDKHSVTTKAQQVARAILNGTEDHVEYEYTVDAGSRRGHFLVQARALRNDSELLVVLVHQEISSLKRLISAAPNAERMMYRLAENMPELFWIYDVAAGAYSYMSPAIEQMFGVPAGEVINKDITFVEFIHPDDRAYVNESLERLLQGETQCNIDCRIITAQGKQRWINNNSISLRDENEKIVQLVGVARDITEAKLYEKHLLETAYRDDLTGLSNRKALNDHLAQSAKKLQPFVLLLLNIDRFKNINDTLGHGDGDNLLRLAANRLREKLAENIFIARTGGDEFAVVCAADQRHMVIDAALECFTEAFPLADESTFVTASLGVAMYPEDSENVDEIMKYASAALRRAKAAGRNNCQWFKDSMSLPSRERLALENELHTALQRGEFELFYQGKFDLMSGALVGVEALLRWRSQKRGLVSPADFIPLLEETGMIISVGEWVLTDACRQARHWYEGTGEWLPVAVNVSVLQIASRTFAEKAIAILYSCGVPANIIELEITESALMTDIAYGAQLIQTLKSAGFLIALDDFGTGYSSLGYLRKFMPSTLKMDRSFIADLATESNDREIVGGIIQLAKALNINVVAEGIELVEQRNILCELGCAVGQGYLFGRPVPAEQFEVGIMAASAGAEIPPRVRAAP